MQTISGTTQLLGVIGDPVKHSLSPVMHNAAIAHLGVDYVYLPFPVKPEDLGSAIAGFSAINLVGFNITIPHKQTILPFLSQVSSIAQTVGAVNTVWRTENGWVGTNTDVQGFLAPLRNQSQSWVDTEAIILGSGGAARAVVAGCAELGCRQIHLVGRNWQKLQALQAEMRNIASVENGLIPIHLQIHLWENLDMLLPQSSLLVNTTPVGMSPDVARSPVSLEQMQRLPQGAIVYDLIYTPNPTQFLKDAQQVGAIAIDGLEMLVQQGAAALQIWLQQPVPVDIMGNALRQHLGLSQTTNQ